MYRWLLPFILAALCTGPARADCELPYAPPELRARLLAFHHANELRRAQEQAYREAAGSFPGSAGPTCEDARRARGCGRPPAPAADRPGPHRPGSAR
jgi:hypothetical protein